MRTDELDYELPPELIAQTPVEPRDASRLLCLGGRGHGLSLTDRTFADLPSLLREGDVLVRNDTRVLPARARFHKPTGGRVELLFLEPSAGGEGWWEALAGGRVRPGQRLVSERGGEAFAVEVGERLGEGRRLVRPAVAEPLPDLLERYGETPLPPYIKTELDDPERYQTTYASVKGSAAAPTAGLHFTPELDGRLRDAGVTIEELTLHVGLATFKPVTVDVVEDHPLHSEPFSVAAAAWQRIAAARAEGRRIVAVGTTMVRLLEELCRPERGGDGGEEGGRRLEEDAAGRLTGRTELLIAPGHRFRVVDGLITNFHLPRTTLLALVMAFCGVEETRAAYRHAIARRYRFYSFGDAMLAWREVGEEADAG